MIVETIINAMVALVKLLFGWIDIPDFPVEVQEVITMFFVYIKNGFRIISVFLDMSYVAILISLVVVIVNFEHAYHFVMWIVRKLPFGIE